MLHIWALWPFGVLKQASHPQLTAGCILGACPTAVVPQPDTYRTTSPGESRYLIIKELGLKDHDYFGFAGLSNNLKDQMKNKTRAMYCLL